MKPDRRLTGALASTTPAAGRSALVNLPARAHAG